MPFTIPFILDTSYNLAYPSHTPIIGFTQHPPPYLTTSAMPLNLTSEEEELIHCTLERCPRGVLEVLDVFLDVPNIIHLASIVDLILILRWDPLNESFLFFYFFSRAWTRPSVM